MKKDSETWSSTRWKQWRQSPFFLRNVSIYSAIFIIFILYVFFLIARNINKETATDDHIFQPPPPSHPVTQAQPTPPEKNVGEESNRLTILENDINKLQATLQSSHQLIALELLQGILEGSIPLETLVSYLQKNQEPWASEIVNALSTIKEVKTYPQLQELLTLQNSSYPASLWGRVKYIMKSFITVRKIGKDGQPEGTIDGIRVALQNHNIQEALEIFGKMPHKEQNQLSLWKKMAQDRLTLEAIKKKILLECARSN